MTRQEQDERRALKARRKALDRVAQQIAAAGKSAFLTKVPSTRSKQAKWHHELSLHCLKLTGNYRRLRDDMRELDLKLGQKNTCTGGSGALA